ncbi:prephenate dehydrogenase/arogenate dehydrogenase family protein [Streptomyces sp. H27-S2]|uniref:prephenate dehydrogenase/arogenate dehydrogenase family protein n=1 Tax=Streptomyces antarcticus TaxID=2996458 RepID=UPI0022714FF9|nr:prephenate dehydrogenase/arogenate dehydrogenase family protein [Streptomyces sp. H27-S2]MCY0953039.1 prephenate dehydrogenase/arogenate dehydrogenase family protein [Streptomyces sp. H27-S2]
MTATTALRTAVVIGCGTTGTSIALALTGSGVEVTLLDQDPLVAAGAAALGAGSPWTQATPPADLVVVATPPSAVVDVLQAAQLRGLGNVYTDTAGTKDIVTAEAELRGCDLKGYVPGHPLAGPDADPGPAGEAVARAGRFAGRPWILCPYDTTPGWALDVVDELVRRCGAVRQDMAPEAHDEALAAVSHAPYLVQAALAAEFAGAEAGLARLGGPELITAVRAAGTDPVVGGDVLTQNAGPVADILDRIAERIAGAARILREGADTAPVELALLLEPGVRGRRALAGAPQHRTGEDAPPSGRT